MLEYDFNQLDDDFITIWSKYVLYHDTSSIIEPLRMLAEKGQINAVQSWYLIKKPEEKSDIIDNIVDSYRGESYNESLAIAHRIYDRDRVELKELKDRINYNFQLGCDYGEKHYDRFYNPNAYDNEYTSIATDLMKDYRETDYAKALRSTADKTEATARTSKSCFVWERLFEIYASNPLILDNDSIDRKLHEKVRKALRSRLKEEPDHSCAKFTLGKSLLFFGDSLKKELEGTRILNELSKRPLITCRDEKTQDDDMLK